MRIVRHNDRSQGPEVSFVLMDWGCRESFHALEYLANQVTERDKYEIIWIEYYDRQPAKITDLIRRYQDAGLESPVDTWIVLERPKGEVFRKHWINNIGILHARGKIICFLDSDAITSTTVVETIIKEFQVDPNIILYLEEIRTVDKSFYPFNYPNPKEIIATAVNMTNGVPNAMRNFRSGLLADHALIHYRNYGACFCAFRDDLIRMGGWDEHDDYTGYIAGPYELSMRMELTGKREVWSFFELLYHTPHPGNDGIGNYSGPHDGRGVSTTAMKIIETKRITPLKENLEIRALREKMPPVQLAENVTSSTEATEREFTPTSPQKPALAYLSPNSATNSDEKPTYLLAALLERIEWKFLDYRYPRRFALGAYAAALARRLNLSSEKIEEIYLTALFCDIGKGLGAPDPGSPPQDDKSSPLAASCAGFFKGMEIRPFDLIEKSSDLYLEDFDGSGPRGLRDAEIPLEVRIIALAHWFDTRVNLRGRTKATPFFRLYNDIRQESAKKFDPAVVDAFVEAKEDFVCIHLKNQNDTLDFMYPCYRFDEQSLDSNQHRIAKEGEILMIGEHMEFKIYSLNFNAKVTFIAVPLWEVGYNLFDLKPTAYTFMSEDLDNLKERITPKLIVENYHGFNVISCCEKYFALQLSETSFSVRSILEKKYQTRFYQDTELGRLKQKIMKGKFCEATLRPVKQMIRRLTRG